MTTQANNPRIAAAIKRGQADIASLLDWMESELETQSCVSEFATWAEVNRIESIRDDLKKTLACFSGVSEPEIQRSLDELRM